MAHEIVGRGPELAALEPFLARAGEDLPSLVFEGEAGIGKSTVWQATADAAAEPSSRNWTSSIAIRTARSGSASCRSSPATATESVR